MDFNSVGNNNNFNNNNNNVNTKNSKKINYTSFIVYLRSLISTNKNKNNKMPTMMEQLVMNGTDDNGLIIPIRNWLLRNTDVDDCVLTTKDLHRLFREFNVVYEQAEFEDLRIDIGNHVDVNVVTNNNDENFDVNNNDNNTSLIKNKNIFSNSGSLKKHLVDTRNFMKLVLKTRPHWTKKHVYLCKRILNGLKHCGIDMLNKKYNKTVNRNLKISNDNDNRYFDVNNNNNENADDDDNNEDGKNMYTTTARNVNKNVNNNETLLKRKTNNYLKNIEKNDFNVTSGIETFAASKIVSRLKTFAVCSEHAIKSMFRDNNNNNDVSGEDKWMLEKDVFQQLTRVTGLSLTNEDILILADATDFFPEANFICIDVLFDVFSIFKNNSENFENNIFDTDYKTNSSSNNNGYYNNNTNNNKNGVEDEDELSEAGVFALNHLKNLLWSTASKLQRNVQQWCADVRAVFKGFLVSCYFILLFYF
jgi:hypothetical protein